MNSETRGNNEKHISQPRFGAGALHLVGVLLPMLTTSAFGQGIWTPEVDSPFAEGCVSPPLPPSPPVNFVEPRLDGRLVASLRAMAQRRDPLEILKQAAVSRYLNSEFATAFADLAVTGRQTYAQFRSRPPQESDLLDDVRRRLLAIFGYPPDEVRLSFVISGTLDRAYDVAWALRDPNPVTRAQRRSTLGWIAVSSEDDSPDRPVNVSSAPFPQFDLPVTTQGHTIQTRYMIALLDPVSLPTPPAPPIRQVPIALSPVIPDDHEVILFIHGHDSRLEESMDLVMPLLNAGLAQGKRYALVALDLATNGYSEMVEHSVVVPSRTQYSTDPLSSSRPTYPLLDFLVDFVVSFVDTLDQRVPVKNRLTAVIGGSLGGNLSLRLGERGDLPWLRNIVAWSPASVWNSFHHDWVKGFALNACRDRMNENEYDIPSPFFTISSRADFFYRAFEERPSWGPFHWSHTQSQMWYRNHWPCKQDYIAEARRERQEIYNPLFRRWHWRVALEQLLFSHQSTDPNHRRVIESLHTNTLLLAGSEDNYQWTGIYGASQVVAGMARQTPGTSLFVRGTGHSIHNERPLFLARQIAQFLPQTIYVPSVISVSPDRGPNTGGTPVTIIGTNFGPDATVTFGGRGATEVVYWSPTMLTATAPRQDPGPVNVRVTVNGQSGSLSTAFTYYMHPVQIMSVVNTILE